jgi:hypothetical protein
VSNWEVIEFANEFVVDGAGKTPQRDLEVGGFLTIGTNLETRF